MPPKRKIKKESFEPNSSEKKVKIEQKEDQSILLPPTARDLAAAAALSRLEQRNNPKAEANHQPEICGDGDYSEDSDDSDDSDTSDDSSTSRPITFPDKMMEKIRASKAKKGDTTTKDVIYVVAHEHTGPWVDPEFTIVGAYHGFQSANEQAMRYFSELDIVNEDDEWEECSFPQDTPYKGWRLGLDRCVALSYNSEKYEHRVYAKRVKIAP